MFVFVQFSPPAGIKSQQLFMFEAIIPAAKMV